MMNSVAHDVTADHGWSILAVGLIVLYCLISLWATHRYILGGAFAGLRTRMRARARLCLARTGYVGAVITRHTLLLTVNALTLNLSLGLLAAIRAMDDHSQAYALLQTSLHGVAGLCIALIAGIAAFSFALCNEIARQAEAGE